MGSRRFDADWLPMAFGSLPHKSVRDAWSLVQRTCSAIPGWPQLPRKSYAENMYAQSSDGFPGIVLEPDSVRVDRNRGMDVGLDRLYLAYLNNDLSYGRIDADHASALDALRHGQLALPEQTVALRGQITGPVSWGLYMLDQNQQPILYDELLSDAVAKHLRLKAAWQERELSKLFPQTIMILEEPYMASFGSSFVSATRGQVVSLLQEVLSGLTGVRGLHCCGDADWSLILETSVDLISVDTFDYADGLTRYAEQISMFLARGGIIAWGIVPASASVVEETSLGLVAQLEAAIDRLAGAGVSRDAILQAGLVTPSCSLGALSVQVASRVMELTSGVSDEMRRRYLGMSHR